MRITFKKAAGILHLWLGLISGLVIFIVAITGALYVFSDDIMQVTERSHTDIVPRSMPQLTSSQLVAIAQQQRSRFLGKTKINDWDWQTLYRYKSSNKAAEFACRHYNNPDLYIGIYINPFTGKIIYTTNVDGTPFWDILIRIHTTLLLGQAGGYIVDFSTLFLLVMLITGIVLWFPKNKRILSRRLMFKWKPHFRWKRKNYDLHNVLGFYASWIVLFMVITGLAWAFPWAEKSVYWILGSPPPAEATAVVQQKPGNKTDSVVAINRVYELVTAMDTLAYCYHLNIPKTTVQPFEVYARQTRNWSPGNTYYFNPLDGSFIFARKYADLSAGEKYDQLSGDIHYGWVLGLPSKIATFFGCLIVASLPVTGFLIWWGRRKKVKYIEVTQI